MKIKYLLSILKCTVIKSSANFVMNVRLQTGKGVFIALLILITSLFSPLSAQNDNELVVMTWNIRLDTPDDGINQWTNRKNELCNEIKNQSPDVLGVQEAMNNQMIDMRKRLKGYKSIGVARDDGKKAGEFSALFYKKKSLKPVRSGTFWLSETPDVAGSRGWDAACNRVVTWAEFKDKRTGRHFMTFNTHFDHMGDTARVESAQLILRKINELANRLPVVLTGDFNVTAKHRAYRILTYSENEYVMADSRVRADIKQSGPDFTFVGFSPSFDAKDMIDFVFTTWDIDVISNSILDFRQSGKYLSDHLPVTTKLRFK